MPITAVATEFLSEVLQKYPQTGEIYESVLYPGQRCQVRSVVEAQVTFEWIGQYAYVPAQSVPVNRFVQDFRTVREAAEP